MVETVDLKCNSCGFIGNKLSKDWIDIDIITSSNFKKQKAYACSKCGAVRIELP